MRTLKLLLFCHIIALVFGLGGLLIALPHPELWSTNPSGVALFSFGMRYAGSLHILFGAAAMLLFGLLFVGTRKTLIFFAASTLISLSMELLGTSTGFPFGPYAYSDLLGYKILGYVPYSIPLSWFYMGFASYLLACLIVERLGWQRPTLRSLVLGIYFLTVWDLSLDPAMASDRLPIHFWSWYEPGPYFGMPIRNLVGWSLTGLIYMSVSRWLWRGPLDVRRIAPWLPLAIYIANTCFAIVLALNAGMWQPLLIALLLGLLPATLVLLPTSATKGENNPVARHMSHLTVRQMGTIIARKDLISKVYGLEHIPQSGPVVLVARHFHHLYDGCILLATLPRRLHFLVALDWIQQRWLRSLMELACGLAEWPIVLREESIRHAEHGKKSAYHAHERTGYLRRAVMLTVKLLRRGDVLVIFPEGYPTIDPTFTPKAHNTAFLPFQPGFVRLIKKAEQDGETRVAIIPVGLNYTQNERWQVTLRFGQALFLQDFHDTTQLMQVVEQHVQELSIPEPALASIQTQETFPL